MSKVSIDPIQMLQSAVKHLERAHQAQNPSEIRQRVIDARNNVAIVLDSLDDFLSPPRVL